MAAFSDDDEQDDDETLADWAKLETMQSSHPMYFAKKLAEVDITVNMFLIPMPLIDLVWGFKGPHSKILHILIFPGFVVSIGFIVIIIDCFR